MEFLIRPWQAKDEWSVQPQILDLLRETSKGGHIIAPTLKNAAHFWKTGLAWSQAGEPTLAAEQDGKVIAWELWGPIEGGLDFIYRVCHGIGSYVAPAARQKGVARALRERATQLAKARGYEIIAGTTYDDRALVAALATGFQKTGQEMKLCLRF